MGVKGGKHVTDVTNASRTMLMNLETLSLGRADMRNHGGSSFAPAQDLLLG